MTNLEMALFATAIVIASVIAGFVAGVAMTIAMIIAVVGLDRLPNALITLSAAAPFAMLMM